MNSVDCIISSSLNIRSKFKPCNFGSKLIHIKIKMEVVKSNWILQQGSTRPQFHGRERPSFYKGVVFKLVEAEPVTRYDIRKVAEDAVDACFYHINEDIRCDLIGRVWIEACKMNRLINNTCGIIKFVCNLQIKHRHTYDGCIPSNATVLESYDGSLDVDHSISCCICLEEIEGGVGRDKSFTLSCSHVLHAECINQWMRRSRFCPLCRHEIPTQS